MCKIRGVSSLIVGYKIKRKGENWERKSVRLHLRSNFQQFFIDLIFEVFYNDVALRESNLGK